MSTLIKLQDVVYTYPQSKHPVLDGLSLTIEKGEIVSLLGANGCGKSTLFKLLIKELTPSRGTVHIKKGLNIAYISQNIHQSLFVDLTVQENLTLMGVQFKTPQETERSLTTFHRNLFAHRDQPVKMLSGGEKQALILAITLFHKPDIVLFDEHTSAMDPEAEKELMNLTYQKIREEKMTVLMCTHKLDLARQYSTRVIGLNKGSISVDLTDVAQGFLNEHLSGIYNNAMG